MSPAREIEVKYRVESLAPLLDALRQRGLALTSPVRQDDQAYAQCGWSYGMSKLGVPFARLRTENGRHLFTLKRPTDNAMACLEFETEVADRGQMHAALQHMGFYPTVRIVKTRRQARYGQMSICLDEVDGVGSFLEIEQLVGPGQAGETVQEELHAFAQSLDVGLMRTAETYDTLVRAALNSS